MPDTYGVLAADVSAELPGLFSGGFSANTKPTATQVTALIAAADTIVTIKVTDVAGGVPASTDKAAVLAKRYVIEWVKAQVVRASFAGNDPAAVKAATDPYDTNADAMLKAIEQLGAQAEGTAAAASRIVTGDQSRTATQRALLVDDTQLDAGTSRVRNF